MSGRLAGRAFVVDGALPSGPELASALVQQGARVLVVFADDTRANALAARLGDDGFGLVADLTTADGVDALGASVPIVLGRLDGAVVRCAGGSRSAPSVAQADDAAWRRACAGLVEFPARAVRELAPQVEDGGAIVLVEPSTDDGPTGVLLPALRALAGALDATLAPAVHVRLVDGAAGRGDVLDALAG